MPAWLLDSMIETGKLMAVLCAVCALLMTYRRTRRATVAVGRFAKRYAPKWLVPVLAVCAFIPGPVDEIAVVAAVLIPVLRTERHRRTFGRYIRTAWKG